MIWLCVRVRVCARVNFLRVASGATSFSLEQAHLRDVGLRVRFDLLQLPQKLSLQRSHVFAAVGFYVFDGFALQQFQPQQRLVLLRL